MTSLVSLVKSDNHFLGTYAALEKIKDEILNNLAGKKKIVIKINFVTTNIKLAVTPSESVRAVLHFLKPYFKGEIVIAEGATMGETPDGFAKFGYLDLAQEYGLQLMDLNTDETIPVKLWDSQGNTFHTPYSKTIKDADYIISITRPKTHDTVVATLTLKNLAVGSLIGPRYLVHQGKMIHRNLVELAKIKAPSLAILDGTISMEGSGPARGTAIKTGWSAASTDFVALDSLAINLMGFKLEDIGYLYLCAQEGLGNSYPYGVEVVGEEPEKFQRQFVPHPTYHQQISWR